MKEIQGTIRQVAPASLGVFKHDFIMIMLLNHILLNKQFPVDWIHKKIHKKQLEEFYKLGAQVYK